MVTSLLLFISTALASRYFRIVGARPLAIIPAGFFVFFLSSVGTDTPDSPSKRDITKLIQQYGLLGSRVITMVGIRLVLHFLHISTGVILMGLQVLNICILIGSLLTRYRDGMIIFHIAYWITTIILRGWSWATYGIDITRELIRLHITLSTAIYAFIYFIVGIFTSLPNSFKEILVILTHSTIIILLLQTSTNIYHGLFIAQVYITMIYSILYYIKQRPSDTHETKTVGLQEILAGQRILGKQTQTSILSTKPQRVTSLQGFIQHTSSFTKAMLSILNIAVILAMMIRFLIHIQQGTNTWIRELLYWLSITLFMVNFILIKKINFFYEIQRIFLFFIINFAIYLSLLNISYLFHRQSTSIVLIATVWNIANSVAIFYSRDIFDQNFIQKSDYYYRIIANLIATIINIILIARLGEIAGQLRFALITMYIGVQGYLMYYNLQYIQKIETYIVK